MKEHKDQKQKKTWKKPEIKELKTRDTEASIGPGGDGSFLALSS